jgi:hypothetical protein
VLSFVGIAETAPLVVAVLKHFYSFWLKIKN